MIRIAAVGDVHLDEDLRGRVRAGLTRLGEEADVLLLAGDLTRHGTLREAAVVVDEFRDLPVPVVAVLGNHDYHSDVQDGIHRLLASAGIHVLEGEAVRIPIAGAVLGVAGVKGFGLGFAGRCGSDFGEPEMKAFVRHGRRSASSLLAALRTIGDADVRVALTHYAPVEDTLEGEPREIWPFLGSHLLAEAVDEAGAHLAVHGHAHAGSERGLTPGGVPVRNVAMPVIRTPYAVYCVRPTSGPGSC
ncbi:MAG: metallophosphoesterase [Actinomycetales bacterium]|nr:metallophosphoesterase [Actinomycetales bacterium]